MPEVATSLPVVFPEGSVLALTSSLLPYAQNARTHSPEQVEQLANSILEFGFLNPVIIDEDNGIIAGHGRVMAAHSLGLDAVPVVRVVHLTDAQRRAYVLADNQISLNAGWNLDLLAQEVAALQAEDFDLDVLGFPQEQIDSLLASLDDPAAFLNDLAQPSSGAPAQGSDITAPDPAPAPAPASPSVPLTLTFAPADRDTVVAYLNRVRDSLGLATTAEALLTLARSAAAEGAAAGPPP